jgi:hypothetical protein
MSFLSMSRRDSFEKRCQLTGGFQPPILALPHYRPRHPPSLRLLAFREEQFRQFGFRPVINYVRCGQRLPLIHPHVERPISLKAEAAVRQIQLRRADTQIKQDPVTTRRRNPIQEPGIIPPPDLKSSGEPGGRKAHSGSLNGRAIVIAAK